MPRGVVFARLIARRVENARAPAEEISPRPRQRRRRCQEIDDCWRFLRRHTMMRRLRARQIARSHEEHVERLDDAAAFTARCRHAHDYGLLSCECPAKWRRYRQTCLRFLLPDYRLMLHAAMKRVANESAYDSMMRR